MCNIERSQSGFLQQPLICVRPESTLTLQTSAEEKRARVRPASGGWPRTVRLRRIEAHLSVREILPETSKGADGVSWREFGGFGQHQVCNFRVY